MKSVFKSRTLWLLLFLSLCSGKLFAVQFTLAYFDKSVYYTDSEIRIKAIIYNDSNEAFFFRTADNRVFNLKVNVRTLDNKTLKESADYAMLQNSNRPYFYRDISLEPGEEYAFVFTLNRFVKINDPGIFILGATYSTDLTEQNTIESNKLYLNVRPRVTNRPEYYERIDNQTQELLTRQELGPDEVISYTLRSLVRQYWNRYFLYLDLEYLIRQSSYYYRRFIASNEQEQRKLLNNFRRAVVEGAIPEVAAMTDVPIHFEVIRTTYTEKEAEVVVSENFQRDGYEELVRYTYYLHKKDSIWYIYRIATQLVRDTF
ncbi:hypothetical protein P0082_08140 [Candidatus Haliotispira prima]|uniref:Uncharacterized protein n=1 Tax=Candidatus Haliotispira prima TaxID=3034016 RepID=A0ABY8MEX3_9SPIO|nr:hypothetical protein P0082_08140 [Candidatus Haliotispira prima]